MPGVAEKASSLVEMAVAEGAQGKQKNAPEPGGLGSQQVPSLIRVLHV